MVYFVKCGSSVKVGYSRSVGSAWERMKNMQTGNPTELEMVKVVLGGLTEERKIHRLFETYLIRGEWYKFDPMVETIINALPNTTV